MKWILDLIYLLCFAVFGLLLTKNIVAQPRSEKLNYLIFADYNYIKNPSFEEHSHCPYDTDQIKKCLYWTKVQFIYNSPDYFHRCSNQFVTFYEVSVGIPENSVGYQEPKTGEAYVGIYAFRKDYYKEYIQTQLKKPLKRGATYIIGMHVSLANNSKYANDRFRFCFSHQARLENKGRRHRGLYHEFLKCPGGVLYKSDTLITDTLNWVNIQIEYTAEGGETFLTIGVFDGDISWWERRRKIRNIFNKNWDTFIWKTYGAYYYIDDVYVIRKEDYLNVMQIDDNE